MYSTKKGVFSHHATTMKRNIAKFLMIMFGSFILFHGHHWLFGGSAKDARVKYAGQILEAQLNYPVETTYQEAKRVVEVLEMKEIIEIRLEALPRSRTLMVIRIGRFGDKNKANVVLNHIVENLREEG